MEVNMGRPIVIKYKESGIITKEAWGGIDGGSSGGPVPWIDGGWGNIGWPPGEYDF